MTLPQKCKLCDENDISNFRTKKVRNKIYYEKICRACESKKALAHYALNKEKISKYQKKYTENNKDIIRFKKKNYDKNRYHLIKDEKRKYDKKYRIENKDLLNAKKRLRRKMDPAYKLRHYISVRICKILRMNGYKKKNSCMKHFNFSFQELKEHLEKQFEPWMNWSNHGSYDPQLWNNTDPSTWTWNIDHIIPQSELPYTSMEDDNFKKCWSLDNLRPLSAKQNILDGISRVRHGK